MRTITFDADRQAAILIDQTRLPRETVLIEAHTAEAIADAIRSMRIRGAPAIGVAAAYGLALGARSYGGEDANGFVDYLERTAEMLRLTRPTAVNLAWALGRGLGCAREAVAMGGITTAREALLALARRMEEDDIATNRRMGRFGLDLVPTGARVLTHCNAGGLATVDYGTALGVVRAAHEAGKQVRALVDETRPFLQGARLTAWELQQLGVPYTLITDNMAGHFMSRGEVDLILVGADRIAANGDTANKIGTYTLAVLAKEHGLPFYVVAPTSTVDLSIQSGAQIPIEERSEREVVEIAGILIAPEGARAAHPAFDVTPARLITAIVTEQGVLRPPFDPALTAAVREAKADIRGSGRSDL